MRRAFTATTLSILLFMVILFGCRSSGDTEKAETQKQFGVRMAKMNLWREAMFRFKRAIDMDPDDAMAHNNLAVAYEANGDFDNAAKEYREALRLDRSNQYIQKNYSRFVEFTQKAKKRQQPGAATTTSTSGTPATTLTGAGSSTTPPPATIPPPPPTDTSVTTPPPPPPGDLP
ncbi:MAG TPA: tetratricopeptide repeat protein [Thermoanaerobaculia bacterium]|nr:tetratricopeptide repeat protein [Thermoanaerobaculia bacterium]